LGIDASDAETVIFQLSDVVQQHTPSKRKYDLQVPLFRKQIWRNIYDAVGDMDSESLALLISLVARSAYLDTLSSDAFNPKSLPAALRGDIAHIIVAVNAGLQAMRVGFLATVTQYTNATSSTDKVVQSLIHRPDMAKHLLALLLSPVKDLQMASQIFLGQAYDVDLRSDCLRAIIKDIPALALDGIATAVSNFNDCAPLFPDACSIAKSLVRCMTDVIEVLTNGRDGLLFDEHFGGVSEMVRSEARLPKLWRLMCGAITTIFRRTPTWSKVNEPEDMVDWMRDALIFARDLVAQRRTFEAAALFVPQQSRPAMASPRKPSHIGYDMLNDLQPVLKESIRWLRLTDMELLHQSSHLVQTLMDCFREAEVTPSQDSLAKLEKVLDASRRKSIPANQQTKLSETHLSELASALSFFNKNDNDDVDDIHIIEEPMLPVNLRAVPTHKSSHTPHNGLRQRKLDGFMVVPSKSSGGASRSLISKPSIETSSGKSVPQSEGRSRQGMNVESSVGSRSIQRADLSSKLSHKERTLKGESISTKLGVSHSSSSSSSSSGSDEEDGPRGLASLGKLQKSPHSKKPAQRRTIRLMNTEFTGRNAALDRIRKREEAHRAALRMKPDLRPLHRIILSWNYDHDGLEPPVLGGGPPYVPVKDQFTSDREYQEIFEPLLTLECWNQLIKSKEEVVPETHTCRINSRQYIDDWLELDVSVVGRPPERWWLAETDIVLLRKFGGQDSILAKVHSSARMWAEIQVTLRILITAKAVDPGLYVSTQWRLTKVFRYVSTLYASNFTNFMACSLSTIAREYAALKALPYYDFYPEIMRPRLAGVPQLPASQVEQAMKVYHVNKPQAIAILGSMQTDGFSLVQGYLNLYSVSCIY
jgi:ATP-dependent RNA/DNA helicase, senataxin